MSDYPFKRNSRSKATAGVFKNWTKHGMIGMLRRIHMFAYRHTLLNCKCTHTHVSAHTREHAHPFTRKPPTQTNTLTLSPTEESATSPDHRPGLSITQRLFTGSRLIHVWSMTHWAPLIKMQTCCIWAKDPAISLCSPPIDSIWVAANPTHTSAHKGRIAAHFDPLNPHLPINYANYL